MKINPLVLLAVASVACSDNDSGMTNPSSATNVVGQVYTMTNAASGNAVLAFDRMAEGSLAYMGSYATGGMGTSASLGNQSGLALDESGTTLVVANAGSNRISAFHVNDDGTLELRSTVASGGTMPVSVTVSHGTVYALNAGGSGNISGFRVSSAGDLTTISGSTRALSTGASGPAQIAFDPAGTTLVVTEKATNSLSSYAVDAAGVATGPTVTASNGATPYGFAFSTTGTLIVSEAFGGAPDASAVSSYRAGTNGKWTVVSPSVATTETAACWIAVTGTGSFAYAANAASGTITGYSVNQGVLTVLDASGVTGNVGAGSGVADMAISRDSKFLYVVAGGQRTISAFAVGTNGALSPIVATTGLPTGVNGLAAR